MTLNILPQPQPKKPTYICTPRKPTHNPLATKKQAKPKKPSKTQPKPSAPYGNHNYN